MQYFFPLIMIFVSICSYSQVNFTWSDGSQYLTGNSQMQAYYLFIPERTNGAGTCRAWSLYITVVNKTTQNMSFYANVTYGGNSGTCGGILTQAITGTLKPNTSQKVRIMPDFWLDLNATTGSPGINFTNLNFY